VTEAIVVDVPDGRLDAIVVEIRHHGSTVASLTVQAAALQSTAPPAPGEHRVGDLARSDGAPAERREREIFEVACDVISAKGFAATSMRDIARAANVSIATLYRYIVSKDELLATITAKRMQELFDHFETNLTSGGTAAERMAEAIAVYLDYISRNHRYINLVYRETKALDEHARARIYDTERRFMMFWQEIIRDGVARGEFAEVDVDLAANLAYFACTVWALRHWSIGDRSEAEVGSLLTRLIVGGLSAP